MDNLINKIQIGDTIYNLEQADLAPINEKLSTCVTNATLKSSYVTETKQLKIDI